MKKLFWVVLFAGFSLSSAAAQQMRRPQVKSGQPTTVQTKKNIIYEPDAELLRELQGKVKVVESKQGWVKFERQSPTVNSARTRAAYTAQFKLENEPDTLFDVIVVHDARSDKFYEIRGFDNFPWRPFGEFKWISDDVLQFDQWVNPNNGGRYRVNLKTGKAVAAGFVRSN